MSSSSTDFAGRLREAILALEPQRGTWRSAKFCPAHRNVKTPALSCTDRGDAVLFSCKRGCSQDDVLEALLGPRSTQPTLSPGEWKARTYRRKTSDLVYEVGGYWHVRTATKRIFWVDPATKLLGLPEGVTVRSLPLYGAESLDASEPVFVNEGEKAADALRAAGLQAVATVTGASATPDDLGALAGCRVILVPDNDEVGHEHMAEIGRKLSGVAAAVVVYRHEDDAPPGWDAANLLWPAKTASELHELAKAPGPTPEVLEALKALRSRLKPFGVGQDAATERVRGALDDLDALLADYIHFPDERLRWACVLWVAVTYGIDVRVGGDFVFDVAPYLWIKSAGRNSGKTTLSQVLAWVARNGKHSSSMTASAFYRQDEPVTPFFDEADNIFRAGRGDDPETARLLQVINGGTTREGTVARTSRSLEAEEFAIFGPKAIVGISVPIPDTTASRCIHVELVRAMPGELPRRFRRREVKPRALAVAATLASEVPRLAVPVPPAAGLPELDFLYNRDHDLWEPLYAIAAVVGGAWPERCLEAARLLTQPDRSLSLGEQLLRDVHGLLAEAGTAFMSTSSLLGSAGEAGWKGAGYVAPGGLLGLEESPWATYRRTKPMNAHDLANLLKPYGVTPDYQDQGGRRGQRGYFRSDIEAAVERWLPDEAAVPAVLAVDGSGRSDRGSPSPPRTEGDLEEGKEPSGQPELPFGPHRPRPPTASTATTEGRPECTDQAGHGQFWRRAADSWVCTACLVDCADPTHIKEHDLLEGGAAVCSACVISAAIGGVV